MKKGLKTTLISTLLVVPMVFCGCDNPFGSGNSIGSDYEDATIEPTNPTPSGGGSSSSGGSSSEGGSSSTSPEETTKLYNPYDYEDSGNNPFSDITSSIAYIKSVYKKGSTSISSDDIASRKSAYETASGKILERLVKEYGLNTSGFNPTTTSTELAPLSNVGANTFKSLGLCKEEYAPTEAEIAQVVLDFMNAKYIEVKTVASSMQYLILSPKTVTTGMSLPSLSYDTAAGEVKIESGASALCEVFNSSVNLGILHNLSDTEAFYKVTLKNSSDYVYLIYNNTFINKFGDNYDKIVDTHYNGIRFNKVSLDESTTSGSKRYNLVSKSWKICENNTSLESITDPGTFETAFTTAFKKRITVELASVMTFGVNDDRELKLPTSTVGEGYGYTGSIKDFYEATVANMDSYYDNYLKFCFTYIEHNGFVAYEADAIAEYFAQVIIGKDVLGLEVNRFSSGLVGNNYQKNFNSNEKVVVNGVTTVRKLISNYNNTNVRALADTVTDKKTEVFKSINYNTTESTLVSHTASDTLSYIANGAEIKTDERLVLFKNYLNTMYSSCYSLVSNSLDDISLEYCDIDYEYLQNVTIIEESTEDEEEGDEEDSDEESYILDTYMAGKLQSIIIFPKEAIDIRYLSIGLEAILNEGDSIEVSVDLRYCYNGTVYYAESAFAPEGGEAKLDSDENILYFEYCSGYGKNGEVGGGPMFKTSDGSMVKEKLLSLKNYATTTPDLRKKKPLIGSQVGRKNSTSGEFTYNNFASSMGANYCYNATTKDYIEICFNITPKYSNFDTNYKLNAKVTSIYGQKT